MPHGDFPAGERLEFSFASNNGASHQVLPAAADHMPVAAASTATSTTSRVRSERIAIIAERFKKLPELTLDEADTIHECFESVMGEKEAVTSCFELRVLLARLGIYPSEEELEMVMYANRERVSLSSLCQYLRFYKKLMDFTPSQSSGGGAVAVSGNGAGEFKAFSTTRQNVDPDTLRAFVALGGNEDGTGEISAAGLSQLIHNFGLTIDMDAMIAAVDVEQSGLLGYADFCKLWEIPEALLRRGSMCSFSMLNARSPMTNAQSPIAGHRAIHAAIEPLVQPSMAASSTKGGALMRDSNLPSPGGMPKPYQPPALTPMPPPPRAALNEPLTEDEHKELLQMYLFPEKFEAKSRRARLDADALAAAQSRLPPIQHTPKKKSRAGIARQTRSGRRFPSPGSRRAGSRRAFGGSSRRTDSRKKRRTTDADEDDVFSLQKGAGGVYQPPSPMILSQRRTRRPANGQQNNRDNPNANGKAYTFNKAGEVTRYGGATI